jgi:hypothetical protein
MTTPLLELIPDALLTEEQEECRPHGYDTHLPVYKLTREPANLEEIDWDSLNDMVIWRDNGTAILIRKHEKHNYRYGFNISFTVYCGYVRFSGAIYSFYGGTARDSEILKTASFFGLLIFSGEQMVHVEIDLDNLLSHCDCDFAKILNPEEIACLMDATPGRQYAFTAGEWSAEQSIVLATRPYSVDLTLGQSSNGYACFEFQDGGTAFVKALETREKIFGSLCLDVDYSDEDWTPLSNKNLKRLFQIETWFEKLTKPILDPVSPCLPSLPRQRL